MSIQKVNKLCLIHSRFILRFHSYEVIEVWFGAKVLFHNVMLQYEDHRENVMLQYEDHRENVL